MIRSTDSTCETDETCCNEITEPDANPGLPPGEAVGRDHRRRNHPSVDIERIGYWPLVSHFRLSKQNDHTYPEPDEVPSTPLTTLRLDRLQVEVCEHQLGSCEPWLAVNGELIRPIGELGVSSFLHDGVEAMRFFGFDVEKRSTSQ